MRRCSYCYNSGHNRATCPQLKKEIRDNPDGYYSRIEKRKKANRVKRPATTRKCGYCKEAAGHNKATCPKLSEDRTTTTRKNRKFRRDFLTACQNVGFGLGALVELVSPDKVANTWQRDNIERMAKRYGKLGMVVGFNSENLNCKLVDVNTYKSPGEESVVKIRFPNGRTNWIALPHELAFVVPGSEQTVNNRQWSIGCMVDATALRKSFSSDWHAGREGVNRQLGLVG